MNYPRIGIHLERSNLETSLQLQRLKRKQLQCRLNLRNSRNARNLGMKLGVMTQYEYEDVFFYLIREELYTEESSKTNKLTTNTGLTSTLTKC